MVSFQWIETKNPQTPSRVFTDESMRAPVQEEFQTSHLAPIFAWTGGECECWMFKTGISLPCPLTSWHRERCVPDIDCWHEVSPTQTGGKSGDVPASWYGVMMASKGSIVNTFLKGSIQLSYLPYINYFGLPISTNSPVYRNIDDEECLSLVSVLKACISPKF